MEGPRARWVPYGNDSSPILRFEYKFMDIIKSLLILVNTSENEHGSLGGSGWMPVPTFNLSLDISHEVPYIILEIEGIQIVESHIAVPTSEHVHQILMNNGCMAEAEFRLWQYLDTQCWLVDQLILLFLGGIYALNVSPFVLIYKSKRVFYRITDFVFIDIWENMHFISTTVNVKGLLILNKRVVSPC